MGTSPKGPDEKQEARRAQKKKDFRSLFQSMVSAGAGLIQFRTEKRDTTRK